MKHGITSNGRTTTYYGNDAQQYMARQAALFCLDKIQAVEMVKNARTPGYRGVLVEELAKQGFTVSKKSIKAFDAADVARMAKERAEELAKVKSIYREYPLSSVSTSSKCSFCKRSIAKRTAYYDGGKSRRAHVGCASA